MASKTSGESTGNGPHSARPGIKQVAELAGVSWKTVSNVVNGTAPVSDATRARVESAIAELGYRPNLTGRHLRQGRSNLLALAFPGIRNPYFADLAHRVIVAAEARGYRVLIHETFGDEASERLVADGFGVHLLDGVIFSPQGIPRAELRAVRGGLPMVLIGEHVLPPPGESPTHDHVVIDNLASAEEATAHLLDQGRRRIAFVGAGAGLSYGTGFLRRAGYESAMAAAGVASTASFIASEYTRAVGAQVVESALEHFRGPDRFDGLICANDQLALGAMRTLRLAGVRVPTDVAVLGWDNIEDGQYADPPLTTVAPDADRLASTAVDLLIKQIDGSPAAPAIHIVPHRLVVRGSSATVAV